ncbi:hypothetical protein LVB77_20600 [Lysobacter sp. 5GHs7-4]|uniref:XVIPCD domain-containing protein n=1 Tax=Lysobacter sp. 5GHs7-4 TaxID=2904253 RepID=UPI001E2ABD14|nr:XVIPCD domain-containing protein [Lysobacter sp. 5GHs7-4]UHQ23015.1 hypothetical protein LVB77_20600 [Lysobacter sp. 5GHs7-4]
MGYEFEKQTFASGQQVTLVSWEDESPTQHGAKLQNKPWKATDARASVGFYDSTVEYMRNDWAAKHMAPKPVVTAHGNVMLYHNASTNTWHSTDALDIDHVVPWKQHFANKGVRSHAEAHMAYNDVANLRMLPAVVNRARDSADNVLSTYGKDSKQWKEWVDERFGFDAKASPSAFDPDKDLARRTVATTSKDWAPDDGRKGLSFDAAVVGKWYEAQLHKQYATTVEMSHPTTGAKQNVPLFYCAASKQLCTRDALDIDHELPFEILAKEMMKHTAGGTATKANALDAYNETSNLRLVSRGANSSHEWELNAEMTYRDDDGPARPGDRAYASATLSSSIRDQVREAMGHGRGTIFGMQDYSFPSAPQASPALPTFSSSALASPAVATVPSATPASPFMPMFQSAPSAGPSPLAPPSAPTASAAVSMGSSFMPMFQSAPPTGPSPLAPRPVPNASTAASMGGPFMPMFPSAPQASPSAPTFASTPAASAAVATQAPAKQAGTGAPTPSSVAPSQSSPILLNDARHPDNKLYLSALAGVQKEYADKLSTPQRESVASSVTLIAKSNQMPTVSRVVSNEGTLYTVCDFGPFNRKVIPVEESQLKGRTMEQNTRDVAALPAATQAATPPAQTRSPTIGH